MLARPSGPDPHLLSSALEGDVRRARVAGRAELHARRPEGGADRALLRRGLAGDARPPAHGRGLRHLPRRRAPGPPPRARRVAARPRAAAHPRRGRARAGHRPLVGADAGRGAGRRARRLRRRVRPGGGGRARHRRGRHLPAGAGLLRRRAPRRGGGEGDGRLTPFTVGIPVFNEEAIVVDNTERLLAFLDGLGREYEVIIGSNGSTDSTTALGVDLSRRFKPVTFFHIPERGVGLAFREFVSRARHPLLMSLDMDLSVDLSFVPTALDLLDTHDIVVGSKKLGKQRRSLFRRLASELFLSAVRLLLGIAYEDYSIAAKAFRVATLRRFIDRIDVGSSYGLEICYLTHRTGGRVVQVPVSCEDWRASKFNLLHEAFYKYRHLLGLWLRYRRGVE